MDSHDPMLMLDREDSSSRIEEFPVRGIQSLIRRTEGIQIARNSDRQGVTQQVDLAAAVRSGEATVVSDLPPQLNIDDAQATGTTLDIPDVAPQIIGVDQIVVIDPADVIPLGSFQAECTSDVSPASLRARKFVILDPIRGEMFLQRPEDATG